jgi:hypothetical protein
MRKDTIAMAAVALFSTSAFAAHDEPLKAKGLKGELVTSYQRCLAPDDTAMGILVPACSPPVRSDMQCAFGGTGSGKWSAKVIGSATSVPPTQDVQIQATIKGITGCEGESLCSVISIRTTTGDCVSGDPAGCTVGDLTDFQVGSPTPPGGVDPGCCVVTGGACKIKMRVNQQIPGVLVSGENTGLQILGGGVVRITGPAPAGPAFTLGVLFK